MSDKLRGGTTIGGYRAWHAGNQLLKGTASIPTSGWVSDGGDYNYRVNIAISNVTSSDWVDVTLDVNYHDTAGDAEICPTCVEYNGGITVYANAAPSVAIPVKYKIVK